MQSTRRTGPGRPPSTTHATITRVALRLFSANGFEATTVEDIAAAVGTHRRTVFRYFPSKNDIVWGDFDWVIARLVRLLDAQDDRLPLVEAIGRAVVASNSYPEEALPELRIRMTLITTAPSLQAHSMLRYAAWRTVVADYAARRLGLHGTALAPQVLGFAALGASTAAFTQWVNAPDADLEQLLADAYALLSDGFAFPRPATP